MGRPVLSRLLKPFGVARHREAITVLLMFACSFLAMAAYTVIKPATRSKFMETLGPTNLPYVQLAAGALIGVVMAGYSWLVSRLPRRWSLPMAQGGIALLLLLFWYLFQDGRVWVSVAFYFVSLILGILLLSQFWTLATVVFDPRQAKRLFGFIGGGSSLGGILGSVIAEHGARQLGTANLLLFSAAFMLLCMVAVILVIRREPISEELHGAVAQAEKGVSGKEALQLLRQSEHLRVIALVISCAAIGATIIDQQLNMAAAAAKGNQATDAITAFLARVQLWTSLIGFLVQVLVTSRIHRHLGIGFALLLLPVSLGSSAALMLFNAALWAPAVARVMDQSLRYSVDKTSREILYMPLPSDIKFTAIPFVDVTVDRFARGLAAMLILFLIKPWGLELNWQKLSYVSIVISAVWIVIALRASHGYKATLRHSIAAREIKPAEVTPAVADPSTIEELIQELASSDERRVVYAIDFLESLDKRNLITPLLLHHESPLVRARALSVIRLLQPDIAARWLPTIEGMLRNENPEVRSAAIGALANINSQQVFDLVRPLLRDKAPRIALTAAMVLAMSDREGDAALGETVLTGLVTDTRASAAPVRRDFAEAIRHVQIPHFRRLLIPLLNDPDPEVAEEAMRSTRKLGATDFIFVTTLISLLRNRRQKSSARELLVGFGRQVLPIMRHFLCDPAEEIWIRRHIPATIARIPCQQSLDILSDALQESDGFLRYHVIAAIERIHRLQPQLTFKREPIEDLAIREAAHCSEYRGLHRALFERRDFPESCLLARALAEKTRRGIDRIYRLLGLLYPWKEIAAARHTMEHGDARSRAHTLEYLDNVLTGALRRNLIPLLEELPDTDSSIVFGLRDDRSALEKVIQHLINHEDPVLSAVTIHFVWQHQLSQFTGDLEQLLSERKGRHRYVLEAASRVSAALRSPIPGGRAICPEPLPSVDLADEMRRLPLFQSVSVHELFGICDAGKQVRHSPGQVLCQEARVPECVQFLLSGRVALNRPGHDARILEAPAALGFQEVLEEREMNETVRTLETAVCVALTNEELLTMLGDNSKLVQGFFQMLVGESDPGKRLVVKGNSSEQGILLAGDGLRPIEKGLVLKMIPVFSEVSPEEIIPLAAVATEMCLTPGAQLFTEEDPPALYAVLSGELAIEQSGNEQCFHAGPMDIVGIFETLAGMDFASRARILREGRALRIDREDLFDLLSHRSGLLRQVFSALFRARPSKNTEQMA